MRTSGKTARNLACLLAFLAPALGSTQQIPRLIGHFHPKVGAWAEYDLSREGGAHPGGGHLRVALVGKDGDAFWVETKFSGGPIGEVVAKVLMSGEPHEIKKMFMKGPTGVRELPSFSYHPPPARRDLKEGGTESVTVPAGTFKASLLLHEDDHASSRSWVKEGLGPWGIAQSIVTSKVDGTVTSLKLQKFGDGAVSEVDETQALPADGMMGGPRGDAPAAGGAGAVDIQELQRRALELQKQYQQQRGN